MREHKVLVLGSLIDVKLCYTASYVDSARPAEKYSCA